MELLALGILLFFGAHAFPIMSIKRDRLVARIGMIPYKAGFAVISLAGLVLMIYGMATGPYMPAYHNPEWGQYAALGLMPLAFILVVAAYVPCNIKRWTLHPMTIGIVLWAVAHLLANSDRMGAMLFGTFAIYGVLDLVSQVARPQPERGPAQPLTRDLLVVVIGLAITVVMIGAHHILFGVSSLPWLFGHEAALPSLNP